MMEVDTQPAQTIPDVEMKEVELSVEEQLKLQEEQGQKGTSAADTADRLSKIVADYRKIQEASAQEIEKKRSAVRSKCQERLWMAGVWRDYQLDIIKRSYEAEVKHIEREHQNEFNSLKETLMQELQEERKRLQALENTNAANLSVDRDGNILELQPSDSQPSTQLTAEEQASGRRLRRRDEKSVLEAANAASTAATASATNTSSSRRKQVNNIYTYNTLLQEQDILDDLGVIAKEAGFLAPTRRSGNKATAALIANGSGEKTTNQPGSTTNVSVENGALHYNWDIISVGDRIRIQMTPSTSPISASVNAISAAELSISTASGRSVKVPILDLKAGKVVILIGGHDHDE